MYTVQMKVGFTEFFDRAAAARQPRHQRDFSVTPQNSEQLRIGFHSQECLGPSASHESLDAKRDFRCFFTKEMQKSIIHDEASAKEAFPAMAPISPATVRQYSPKLLWLSTSLIDTDSNFESIVSLIAFQSARGKAVR